MVRPHLQAPCMTGRATKRLAWDFIQLKKTVLRVGIMCHRADALGRADRLDPHALSGRRAVDRRRCRRRQGTQPAAAGGRRAGDRGLLPAGGVGRRAHAHHAAVPRADDSRCCPPPTRLRRRTPSGRGSQRRQLPSPNRANCEFNGYAGRILRRRRLLEDGLSRSERDDWISRWCARASASLSCRNMR